MQKPKIALLTLRNSYQYGGVLSSVKVVYEFCKQYFEPTVFFLGFDPDVATSIKRGVFTSSTRPLTYFGMNCVEVGARWAFWEPGHYAYSLSHWKQVLDGYDYFFMVSGTCIAAHPLCLLDKKFVMWVSTLYEDDRANRVATMKGIRKIIDSCAHPFMKSIEQDALRKASIIFPLSSYSKEKFLTVVDTIEEKMIPCGFPLDIPTIKLEEKKEKIIIAVGRFSDPRKNFPMLLRMFERVYEANKEARLFVVGMKPLLAEYEHVSEKKFMENIWFAGQVGNADLHELYKRAAVMVVTSYQEGFGIVGIEALARGVPVIATECGGTVDYTIDGLTGYRVAIDDDETMARYVLEVLRNESLCLQLSLAGQQFVAKHYSHAVVYKQFKKGLVAAYPELASLFRKRKVLSKAKEVAV